MLRRWLLRRGNGSILECFLGPITYCCRTVMEAEDKFTTFLDNEILSCEDKYAVFTFFRFDIAVLALSHVRQTETDTHSVFDITWPKSEGVVAKILTCLDVILVAVGPVELDLLTLIGNRIDIGLIDSLREEIALMVVPAEEAVEVVIN